MCESMYVFIYMFVRMYVYIHVYVCITVALKVCYHVLVVIFPMPHDIGCEIKIIVIVRSAELLTSINQMG